MEESQLRKISGIKTTLHSANSKNKCKSDTGNNTYTLRCKASIYLPGVFFTTHLQQTQLNWGTSEPLCMPYTQYESLTGLEAVKSACTGSLHTLYASAPRIHQFLCLCPATLRFSSRNWNPRGQRHAQAKSALLCGGHSPKIPDFRGTDHQGKWPSFPIERSYQLCHTITLHIY